MHIRRSYRTYLPSFSPISIKVWPGHRLLRKTKSKIAAVTTHVPLEALSLVVGGLIVPQKEYWRHRCNLKKNCHVIVTVRCQNISERCFGG